MTVTKPLLYVSRLLPDPVMVAIRERFALVREPIDAAPSLSALQEGLSKAAAAIVTLTDRSDAQNLELASSRFWPIMPSATTTSMWMPHSVTA